MTVKVPIIPEEDLSENADDADPHASDHAEIHSGSTQAEVDEAVAAAKRERLNRATGKVIGPMVEPGQSSLREIAVGPTQNQLLANPPPSQI